MPVPKGFRHSEATKERMRGARAGVPKSDAHRAALGAAQRGRTVDKKHQRTCACGSEFQAASAQAKFCSVRCKRAARGHGLIHAPAFAAFAPICSICFSTEKLVGDHDHATGKPRGVLCRQCNLAIGNMADNPARLRAAAAYLENA